jgi:hypothetical protein
MHLLDNIVRQNILNIYCHIIQWLLNQRVFFQKFRINEIHDLSLEKKNHMIMHNIFDFP